VLKSKSYRETFMPKEVDKESALGKFTSFIQEMQAARYFTPKGMYPILFSDQQSNTNYYGDESRNPKKVVGKIAKDLKVDIVMMIQIDYCYEGGTFTSIGGSGAAKMTASASIKAIDKNGEMIINMPQRKLCGDKGRVESERSTPMIGGNLILGKKFVRNWGKGPLGEMIVDVTEKSADKSLAEIKEAMK